MRKNTNQQRKRSRLGVKLVVSVAILAAAIVLSPSKAQAFTLIEQPVSHLDLFAPISVNIGQLLRLNAANVFCPTDSFAAADGSVRMLFRFFNGDGSTLKEEIKSVACGQVATSELPSLERTDVGGPHVYGLIAVLSRTYPDHNNRSTQGPGNTRKGFCPSDLTSPEYLPGQGRGGPLATSLEVLDLDGSIRQGFLPAIQRTCGK